MFRNGLDRYLFCVCVKKQLVLSVLEGPSVSTSFRCQQPKEVLKKKTFTVLYRVPNLKKKIDVLGKRKKMGHIFVFKCSFFLCSAHLNKLKTAFYCLQLVY